MDWKGLFVVLSVFIFGYLESILPFYNFQNDLFTRIYNNLFLGFTNLLFTQITLAYILHWIWQQNLWYGWLNHVDLYIYRFCLSFLLLDGYMYFWHRFMHSVSWGWKFHQVHHTDAYMNVSTAYRFHTVEVFLSGIPKLFLIWVFGISLGNLLLYEILYAIELVFHHSNFALPLKIDKYLSYVIVTPNYHRAHHSQCWQETQTNYASFLTIWDKLFKSYAYPQYPHKIKLGLEKYNNDLNIIELIKMPLYH